MPLQEYIYIILIFETWNKRATIRSLVLEIARVNWENFDNPIYNTLGLLQIKKTIF